MRRRWRAAWRSSTDPACRCPADRRSRAWSPPAGDRPGSLRLHRSAPARSGCRRAVKSKTTWARICSGGLHARLRRNIPDSGTPVYAQKGTVAGNVIDGDYNNEPLAFANIIVKGTTIGTTSDFDGKYKLDLDEGTYTLIFSFVGYNTQEITGVVIKPNQVFDLDITLGANSLDEILIVTSAKRNTESAVLDLQKRSVNLVDGLSIQSIKKSGASDLASAVKSVPGVSVEGGKYVLRERVG